MRSFLLGFTVCAAALFIGCGGGEDRDNDEEVLPEDSLARSMLLTVTDFPTGWAEVADESDEESPTDKCELEKPAGRTGYAETGDFSEGGVASVSEQLAIFEGNEQTMARLSNVEELVSCIVGVFNEGDADDRDLEYSDASFSPVSFPSYGDETRAYRFAVTAKQRGEDGPFSEVEVFIDVVYVVVDRVGISVQAVDILSPFPSDEMEEIVEKAVDRVGDKSQ